MGATVLTPQSPNALTYAATGDDGSVLHPTSVVLSDIIDDSGASATFVAPTMAWDGIGAFVGTLAGACIPLGARGLWTLVWQVTTDGLTYTDSQPVTVGFSPTGTLCTRQMAKDRVLLTTEATDGVIDSLIATVLPKVNAAYCREFMPHSDDETRIFDLGTHLVDLTFSDLRSCTSVVLDPNGTPVTLAAGTDYILRPGPMFRACQAYAVIRLSDSIAIASDFARKFGTAQVAVTGDWGVWNTTDDVPADIQEAAIECVLAWIDMSSGQIANIDSSSVRQVASGPTQTWGIPFSAHRAFAPYSRNYGVA